MNEHPVNKATAAATGRQYHIRVAPGEVGTVVLMPGDPFRVQLIADRLTDAHEVAHFREYRTVTGYYKGTRVSATSTGIGCPSTAIAVEELAHVGAQVFLRVGSTGALQPHVNIGDLVVSEGAFRADGATKMYVPRGYPAVPDLELTLSLRQVAEELARQDGFVVHVGLNATSDAFYAETPEWISRMSSYGLLNVEMESAAMFVVARLRGLKAGMVCAVSGNLATGEVIYGEENPRLKNGWGHSIDVALEAAYRLGL